MPTILGANSVSGYEISNTLRFNDGDSPKLTKTFGSAGTSVQTFTISFWVKKCLNGKINDLFGVTNGLQFVFRSGDDLRINFFTPGSDYSDFITNQLFRDPSAWYHIVLAVDTTQGTEANRKKLYVNGSQVTSFATQSFPTQNRNLSWNSTAEHQIGYSAQSNNYSDIYLSDFNSIDGQALTPSSFGKTNNNGVWIPKKYTGSYGDNGFFLEFKQTGTGTASASTIGADTSGNTNHFTSTNLAATDITTDTPTNNFATMNPVHVSSHGSAALPTFSEGNLKIGMNSDSSTSSTIAPSKGKWYVEYKQSENTADNQGYPVVAISATLGGTGGDLIGFRTPDSTNYRGQLGTTSVNNAFGSARSANDIFGFYINLDDDILIVHKNGSDYMGSGASSGLDWSGGLTTTNEQTGFYHFYVQNNSDGSPRYTDEVNFGNPTFSISSSNSDANGYGSFEYSPTLSGTAFYAMCTKNLAEFG